MPRCTKAIACRWLTWMVSIGSSCKAACVSAGRPCQAVAVGSSQSSGSSGIAPGTFLRTGSVDAVKQLCSAGGLDRVVVNNVLSGVQQRNLEAAWGCARSPLQQPHTAVSPKPHLLHCVAAVPYAALWKTSRRAEDH